MAASISISLLLGEALLRAKNSSMDNYDVEMWRYANELKQKSTNPILDFEHKKSKSAILQNKTISLNSYGLRNSEIPETTTKRRILFLGGSITLGWGVEEENIITTELSRLLNKPGEQSVEVLNAGVGNYNASRYTERFFQDLTVLKPTDIVVQYFLRDAEDLQPSNENYLLSNSQLALTLWILQQRTFAPKGKGSLEMHYKDVYQDSSPGFLKMQKSLKKLAAYAKKNKINLYMLMTPDIHNLSDYKFGYIHEKMENFAASNGFIFVDSLPQLKGLSPEDLYAMPGDPHPNALGHKIMAETIAPVLLGNKQ